MLQVSLKVVGGKHDGEVIPLSEPKFLIGRESDCHLRPNSEAISRHHCAFTIDDYSVRLRDLGSTNGTYVNGERVRGVASLKTGDTVSVGKLEFVVVVGDEAVAPQSVESPLHSETAELSSDETAYEMPAVTSPPPAAPQESDTTMIPAAEAQPAPAPQQPPQGVPYQYPPQAGFYPPQMPYPGQPPTGGYFPQYPYPYPQPVVMGQPYPQQGYPQAAPQPQQPAQPAPAAPANGDSQMDVRLPDPSTTGVKQPEAAAPAPAADGEAPPKPVEKNPSEHAADIIRGHLHRRPE